MEKFPEMKEDIITQTYYTEFWQPMFKIGILGPTPRDSNLPHIYFPFISPGTPRTHSWNTQYSDTPLGKLGNRAIPQSCGLKTNHFISLGAMRSYSNIDRKDLVEMSGLNILENNE